MKHFQSKVAVLEEVTVNEKADKTVASSILHQADWYR